MKVNRGYSASHPLLIDALRLLPNIRPVCERHRLGEAKHHASLSPNRTASFSGVSLTLLELEELFLSIDGRGPHISQAGARLLLRLFSHGAFDAIENRPVEGGPELLAQYSKGLVTLLGSNFWPRARRQAAPRKKFEALHPDEPLVSVADTSVTRVNHWANMTVHRMI